MHVLKIKCTRKKFSHLIFVTLLSIPKTPQFNDNPTWSASHFLKVKKFKKRNLLLRSFRFKKVPKISLCAANGWRAQEWAEREETRQTMHVADKRLGRALSQLINQPATDKQTQLERWGTAYRSRRFRSIKSRSNPLHPSPRRYIPETLEIFTLRWEKEFFIKRKIQWKDDMSVR